MAVQFGQPISAGQIKIEVADMGLQQYKFKRQECLVMNRDECFSKYASLALINLMFKKQWKSNFTALKSGEVSDRDAGQ